MYESQTKLAEDVAKLLLQIKAIKLSPQNPFTWASGISSPIYCDNRVSLSFPSVRDIISNGLSRLISNHLPIDAIAGVATAGIPHGAIAAYRLGLPFVYVRDKAKSHGRNNQIEGYLPENSKVVMVEDLISTGGSSLKAADALISQGHEVIAVIAIFSYQLPEAIANFSKAGIPYFTITNYDILIKVAEYIGYITPHDLDTLEDWKNDPQSWHPS